MERAEGISTSMTGLRILFAEKFMAAAQDRGRGREEEKEEEREESEKSEKSEWRAWGKETGGRRRGSPFQNKDGGRKRRDEQRAVRWNKEWCELKSLKKGNEMRREDKGRGWGKQREVAINLHLSAYISIGDFTYLYQRVVYSKRHDDVASNRIRIQPYVQYSKGL